MTAATLPVDAQVTARPRRGRAKGGGLVAWAFALPALIVYVVFLVYPALQSLWFSFTNWDGLSATYDFVGLDNYAKMPKDPVVVQALINNAIWTIVTITVPVIVGLLLAILLNVNEFLRAIGLGALAQPWLGQNSTALAAVMLPAIWLRVGFPMLLYLAALQGINTDMYEAATVDGASKWQQFWFVTMPSLRPAHYIVIALSLIDSFKVFDLIYAMTYGGPGTATQVMGTWMYFNVFQYYQAGYGTAIAVVITVIAVTVSIPYVRSQTKEHS
jgi:ABC-type sugar transport system permease subunit